MLVLFYLIFYYLICILRAQVNKIKLHKDQY